MNIGFDIISDLWLDDISQFNWEGKPTSLYCIISGNITSDLGLLHKIFLHLSKCYQGIFYIDGTLEHTLLRDKQSVINEISAICTSIPNVVYLHNNVVVIEGIAIVGLNGWNEYNALTDEEKFQVKVNRYDDLLYLDKTIEKLQLHIDVKKIVITSNSVPNTELYFGEQPESLKNEVDLDNILSNDTEQKITHWVFGSHKKIVDTNKNGINYLNNPMYDSNPYYAKRIDILY
jgi:hypothetical protein